MLYTFLLTIVLIFLILERRIHQARLKRIPLRIHVNGTRGKTTVTRLTAELLRRSGVRTVAKTTGDLPVLIHPDGRSVPIQRCAPARIQEQMRIVAGAVRAHAHAVVLECMALDPALQHVCEEAIIHATIGVITNAHPDHQEVVGSAPESAAHAISRTIPTAGVLITGGGPSEAWFRECARLKDTAVCTAAAEEALPGLAADNPIIAENLALVRSIGISAGIPAPEVDGILKRMAAEERGRAIRSRGSDDRRFVLVDAFSINDTVSAERFQGWALAANGDKLPRPWVALLNTRPDRPIRTREFCRFIAAHSIYDAVGLAGGGRLLAQWYLRPRAVRTPVFMLPDAAPTDILQSVGRRTGCTAFTIVGLGNHRGIGAALRKHFDEAASCC